MVGKRKVFNKFVSTEDQIKNRKFVESLALVQLLKKLVKDSD